jgi:hypothetical protein
MELFEHGMVCGLHARLFLPKFCFQCFIHTSMLYLQCIEVDGKPNPNPNVPLALLFAL